MKTENEILIMKSLMVLLVHVFHVTKQLEVSTPETVAVDELVRDLEAAVSRNRAV